MKHQIITTLIMGIVAGNSMAQETRQHSAHAHGIGELNIAFENNNLLIELISPAINIVGFEHKPNNAEQKQQVSDAIHRLEQADELFITTEQALCKIEHVHIESIMLSEHHEGEEDHAHEDEEHHEDEEDHAHEDEEHHEDEEDHAHEDEEHHEDEEDHAHEDEEHHEDEEGHAHEDDHESDEETHSDFVAEYEFHCDNPEKLTQINIRLLETFPLTEKLNAQVLSPSGQSAKTLTKEDSTLDL